jgi:hypothetical protein
MQCNILNSTTCNTRRTLNITPLVTISPHLDISIVPNVSVSSLLASAFIPVVYLSLLVIRRALRQAVPVLLIVEALHLVALFSQPGAQLVLVENVAVALFLPDGLLGPSQGSDIPLASTFQPIRTFVIQGEQPRALVDGDRLVCFLEVECGFFRVVGRVGAELDELYLLVEVGVTAMELANTMGELAVFVVLYRADEEVVVGGLTVAV